MILLKITGSFKIFMIYKNKIKTKPLSSLAYQRKIVPVQLSMSLELLSITYYNLRIYRKIKHDWKCLVRLCLIQNLIWAYIEEYWMVISFENVRIVIMLFSYSTKYYSISWKAVFHIIFLVLSSCKWKFSPLATRFLQKPQNALIDDLVCICALEHQYIIFKGDKQQEKRMFNCDKLQLPAATCMFN